MPAGDVDEVLAAYRAQGARLVTTARGIDLVGQALRGEIRVINL